MNYQCIIWGTPFFVSEDPFFNVNIETIANSSPYIKDVTKSETSTKYEVCNPRAGGKYTVSKKLLLGTIQALDKRDITEKIRLSGWIAKENLKGGIPPSLDSIIDQLEKLPPVPDQSNIKEKSDLLLAGLTKLYPNIGTGISLNINGDLYQEKDPAPFLYALSYCATKEEFNFLINSLNKSKDIEIVGDYTGGQMDIQVTEKGWDRVNALENTAPSTDSNQAFIAMWIDPSMDKLKQSIKTAIEEAGYKPLRIDDKKHSNKIDDEILSEIEKSHFIICDLTSSAEDKPRGSVYFEAGYAKGKSIPVIWTCNEKMKKAQSNSFDTRQYKCLFWNENNMDDFTKDLQAHIEKDELIRKRSL